MKKLLLIVLLLLVVPAQAYAHTGLKNSSPSEKETVTKPLTDIVMEFNTSIEKLSTFTLTDSKGAQVKPESVVVDGAKMSGKLPSALPNGDYTVNWNILGEDGHNVQGKISFTLNAPAPSPSPSPSASPSPTPTAASASPSASPAASPSAAAPSGAAPALSAGSGDESDKGSAGVYIAVIAGVAVVGLAILLLMRRRSRR